ncbi:non-ribosomal peptide synthetase [Clostridium felsineum]|uniref:non-ribosomal peptide synthetase n=1 Tax=Clostridium felsineum TaxID=36839 RepID=UPI00098C5966|nr:non-ribosomal peptide synthetase [Clostridium felsineum]URZ17236.1 Gramicidin S synthase 2 [Clostridium felsineum DSM 794]
MSLVENNVLDSGQLNQAKNYWEKVLSGDIVKSSFHYDYINNNVNNNREKKEYRYNLPESVFYNINKICNNSDQRLHMFLSTALTILLYKYTGNSDVIIGMPIYNQGFEGNFINTMLPLRILLDDKMSFKEALLNMRNVIINANKNENCPIDRIIGQLTGKSDKNEFSIYDSVIMLEGIHNKEYIKNSDVATIFNFINLNNHCEGVIEYKTDKYKEETIERIAAHFINLLTDLSKDINKSIEKISMISNNEKVQLLQDFNNTLVKYEKNKNLVQLFEEQVDKTPDEIAILFKNNKLTYRELNEKSNQLARILKKMNIEHNAIVGLCSERSIEMIIGMFAILKIGATYLPIDPCLPKERMSYILKDSGVKILLKQEHINNEALNVCTVLNIDKKEIDNEDNSNLNIDIKSNDLAYVIYTSGTTGVPKGVLIEHKSIVNSLIWRKKEYDFSSKDTVIELFAYYFDGFFTNFFTPIISGSKVIIVDENEAKNPETITKYIVDNKVTHLICIPALYLAILDYLNEENAKSLRVVTLAGDHASDEINNKSKNKNINVELVNEYGPTENTVVTTFKRNKDTPINSIIGKPIYNTNVFILSRSNQLQPVGVFGEICISGIGLARGYLNRPKLTKEKFIENPFFQGRRMYKTGDIGKWLPDGNIELIGRLDNQVKIRGYRIETDEVEKNILEYNNIKEAVVVAKNDNVGNEYLCAFFVADKKIFHYEIQEYLSQKLPKYMIPQIIIQLDKIPLTAVGKIDKKSLQQYRIELSSMEEYVEPRNEIEKRMCDIWKSILNISKIGVYDNFFEIGGHSLNATTLIYRIHKEFDVSIQLKQLFDTATIDKICKYIRQCKKENFISINSIEKKSFYSVSSAQKRMFVLWKMEGNSIGYNAPTAIEIKGHVDEKKLEFAFQLLIKRHESLRTYFRIVNDNPVQVINDNIDFKIDYVNSSEEEVQQKLRRYVRPFNLMEGPLIRVMLIKINNMKNILMIDIHHIICDGMSFLILLRELFCIYKGEMLEPLSIQYKDYSYWQNDLVNSGKLEKQEKYWLNIFSDEYQLLNLRTDFPRPLTQSFEGNKISFQIDSLATKKLKSLMREENVTLFAVILSIYNIFLSKLTGQEDIIIGTPVSGRTHSDLEGLVGMFVNTLALRNYPAGSKNFLQLIHEVMQNTLDAQENQDYPFEKLVEKLELKNDLSRNPLFDTMFVLNNIDEPNVKVDGIEYNYYNFKHLVSKFDLLLSALEKDDTIEFTFEYSTKLFTKDTIEKFKGYFTNLINEISDKPNAKVFEFKLISDEEEKRIIHDFNHTSVDCVSDKCLHKLFEEQVDKTPNNISVLFGDYSITYSELNKKANQLANVLSSKGVQDNDVIGIMIDRTIEMIIGILGIMKAGAAYLPIDVSNPEQRISYMLNDSKTNILLVNEKNKKKAESVFDKEIINLDNNSIYTGTFNNSHEHYNTDKLAYIIYTSGTTGKPKGVMIEHKNITNSIQWRKKEYKFNSHDNILQLFSFAFDGFVSSFFTALVSGAKIIILNEKDSKDPYAISRAIAKYKITHFIAVPTLYMSILECIKQEEAKSIRVITLAGEKVKKSLIDKTLEKGIEAEIINEYGPTENSVITTFNRNIQQRSDLSIGRPIWNTNVFILDKYNNIVPIGIPGEICISGFGLAKGYLNMDNYTAERFIYNETFSNKRIYKTGDTGRWLPDGRIEYIGRIDEQVKIRGYRIEINEIEKQILSIYGIKQVAVLVDKEEVDDARLYAFYMANRLIEAEQIRLDLSLKLPDYMIPSKFIQIKEIPLTQNGKINKSKLKELVVKDNNNKVYVGPRNDIEKKLVKIWEKVLHREKIDINDDFFELGGHSLYAIKLEVEMQKENINIEYTDIYKLKTISQIAKFLMER